MVLKQSIVSVEEFKGWGLPNQVQDVSDAMLSSWLLQSSRIVDLSMNNLVSRLDLLNPDSNIPSIVLEDIKQAVIELVNYFMGGNYLGDEQKVSQTFNNGIASFQRDADTFGSMVDALPIIVKTILQNSPITLYEFNPDVSPQISPTEFLRKEDATSDNIKNDSTKAPGDNVTKALDSLYDDIAAGWNYDAEGNKIINVKDPTDNQDVVTKAYFDWNTLMLRKQVVNLDENGEVIEDIFHPDTNPQALATQKQVKENGGGGASSKLGEVNNIMESRNLATQNLVSDVGENLKEGGAKYFQSYQYATLPSKSINIDATERVIPFPKGTDAWEDEITFTPLKDTTYLFKNLYFFNLNPFSDDNKKFKISQKLTDKDGTDYINDIYYDLNDIKNEDIQKNVFSNFVKFYETLDITKAPYTYKQTIQGLEGSTSSLLIGTESSKTDPLYPAASHISIIEMIPSGEEFAYDKDVEVSDPNDYTYYGWDPKTGSNIISVLQYAMSETQYAKLLGRVIKIGEDVDKNITKVLIESPVDINMNNQKLINVKDGTLDDDVATIGQLKAAEIPIEKQSYKDIVKIEKFLLDAYSNTLDGFTLGTWKTFDLGLLTTYESWVDGDVIVTDQLKLTLNSATLDGGDVYSDGQEFFIDMKDIELSTSIQDKIMGELNVGNSAFGELNIKFNIRKTTTNLYLDVVSYSDIPSGTFKSVDAEIDLIKLVGVKTGSTTGGTGFANDIINYETNLNLGSQNTQLDNLELGDRILYRDYSNKNLAAQHTSITSIQSAIPLPNLNTWINEYDFVVSEDAKYNYKHLFFFKLLFSTDKKKFRIGSAFHDATTGVIKGSQEQDFDFSKYTNDEIKEQVFSWFRNINVDLVTGSTYVFRMTLQGLEGSVGTLSPVVTLSAPHLYELPTKSHFELAHLISKIKPAHKQNMEVQVWHSATRAGGGDNAIVPITTWGEITEKTNKQMFEFDNTTHKFHPTAYLVNLANNSPDGVLIQIEFQCAGFISNRGDYYVNCETDFTGTISNNLLLAIQVDTTGGSYFANNTNTVYKIVKFFPKNLQSTDSFKLLKKAVDVSQADIYPPYNMLITNLYLTGVKGEKGDPGTSTPPREVMYSETLTINNGAQATFNMIASGINRDFKNIQITGNPSTGNTSILKFINNFTDVTTNQNYLNFNVDYIDYPNKFTRVWIRPQTSDILVQNNTATNYSYTLKVTGERIPVPRKKEDK